MSLTRRLLRELGLSDEAVERVIEAHVATVEALRTERDAAIQAAQGAQEAERGREEMRLAAEESQKEVARIREEYEGFRAETIRLQTLRREAALADALRRAGANETAIPLLVRAIPTQGDHWAGDSLVDEAAALQGVQAEFAGLFTQVTPLPTDRCTPPLTEDVITPDDVRRMSPAEINRHWNAVRDAIAAPTGSRN